MRFIFCMRFICLCMKRHILLCAMLLSYGCILYIISEHIEGKTSISNIICDTSLRHFILLFFMFMAIFTILYENYRNHCASFWIILSLIVNICVLLFIQETKTLHYVFCYIIFLLIFLFMFIHRNKHICLFLLLWVQFFFYIGIQMFPSLFLHMEVLIIGIFALYYLVLHFV